jgi:hypothetical protein
MTRQASQFKTETALQRERRIFQEEVRRLRNCLLNKAFDLTAKGSRRRLIVLIGMALLLGVFISLQSHPLIEWAAELSRLFQYMFNPVFTDAAPDTPAAFVSFALGTFFEPKTLRFLPVFALPFLFALQAAATYLADVFELDRMHIARQFILGVAFNGGGKTVRIGAGEVATESLNSPVYLIGGPGKVVVELDTVAVFEKPNGQPHIIGPTVKGGATLESFERFRQALDLRDQYTDPLEVKSRSLDGLNVSAKDVRMVFSIWREGKSETNENPHPFSKKAVETLVYGQTCSVVADGPYPSECNPSWSTTIQTLIRNELDKFMAERHLAEYLASIGQPEVQQARKREEEIAQAGQAIVPEEDQVDAREVPPPPNFQARHNVSSLFSQFAQDFTDRASESGVELKWIGIGIWKTPNEIIPEKHLEAWRLSRENLTRGNPGAMNGIRREARLQSILRMIQTIPLVRFRENLQNGKSHTYTMRDLLLGYREQFIESMDLVKKVDKPLHEALEQAVKSIESALNIRWLQGSAGPAAPGSSSTASGLPAISIPGLTSGEVSIPTADPEEESLFLDLLEKVDQDPEQVEELIENESKRAPQSSRKDWLRQAIDHWPGDDQ